MIYRPHPHRAERGRHEVRRIETSSIGTPARRSSTENDIAPPYEPNWRFFEHLRETILKGCVFVITSTNAARVEGLAGRTPRIYEVVGKPLDLDAIVAAVRDAMHARPTE